MDTRISYSGITKKFPRTGNRTQSTTCQYGDDGNYAWGNAERMRQAGIWTTDDVEYYEDPHAKYLVVPDVLTQVKHSSGQMV